MKEEGEEKKERVENGGVNGARQRPKEKRRAGKRVAKYRSSSPVRNKEQKIDRLLSFMLPGAVEGGSLPPPGLSTSPFPPSDAQ